MAVKCIQASDFRLEQLSTMQGKLNSEETSKLNLMKMND